MRSGESFSDRGSDYYQSPAEQMKRDFKELAWRLRIESDDPLAHEIAEKIEVKLEIKDMAQQVSDHLGDTRRIYQLRDRDDMVLCGIFVLRKAQAKLDWSYPNQDFDIKAGETYLDLHLPPQNKDTWTVAHIKDSLRLMAQYIAQEPDPPKYIVGISYDAIVNRGWIQKAGFSVVKPDPGMIPADVRASLRDFFQGAPEIEERLRKKIDGYGMCFASTDAFVARWGPSKEKPMQ